MKTKQRGGTLIGLILGIVIGLGAALAVAVYVTKVPVPFITKVPKDTEAQEAERNKGWDPNSPLYGKNPASTAPTLPVTPSLAPPVAPVVVPGAQPVQPTAPGVVPPGAVPASPVAPAVAPGVDPLADLANQKIKQSEAKAAAAAQSSDAFDYFIQAGAFRTQADADAQRAKLAMLGWESRVSEREQNGRTVFRVRVGPFGKREDAEQLKGKLDGAGVDSALVRVQR